jgi:hypothetical protein
MGNANTSIPAPGHEVLSNKPAVGQGKAEERGSRHSREWQAAIEDDLDEKLMALEMGFSSRNL